MDLMEIRRRIMLAQDHLVPFGYRQIEYLKNSGTQYINTNVSQELNYEIDFVMEKAIAATGPLGWWIRSSQQNIQYYEADGIYGIIATCGTDNEKCEIGKVNERLKVKLVDKKLYINDVQVHEFRNKGIFLATNPVYLFAYSGGNGTPKTGHLRIYSCKIYDLNDSLLRNFIPCIRKSDDKPGMYDAVTKQFFTNAGTGEFIIPD